MKPSQAQINFFQKLTEEKQFPDGTNLEDLREEFEELNQKSASAWIEAAMKLDKIPADPDEKVIPAPFVL